MNCPMSSRKSRRVHDLMMGRNLCNDQLDQGDGAEIPSGLKLGAGLLQETNVISV